MSLQPISVAGSSIGWVNNVKPFYIPDQAFQYLINAYVYRERVKKREGLQLLGRLGRLYTAQSLGVSGASPWTFNIFTILTITEADAEIQPGFVTIVVGAITFTDFAKSGTITGATNANPCVITTGSSHLLTTGDRVTIAAVGGMTELNGQTYTITVIDATHFSLDNVDSTDFGVYTAGGTWSASAAQGNGNLVSTTPGNSGTINYLTGNVTLTHTAGAGAATTITFRYYPSLPVMGIFQRELGNINNEETIFFDTVYAYKFSGSGFQEVDTTAPNTWSGRDSDFFWAANYRGVTDDVRLFFVTNFNNGNDSGTPTYDPIRYLDNTNNWVNFAPLVSATTTIFQTKLIIPYYGRLLFLNTWEGLTGGGGAGASNFFNRCRFSQIGDPTAADAFRSDIFGKGGFIDAPTNEAITSCAFIKNTLIVFFEKTTWQLRYVGEYGLPFIWERVSSDFGSESKNSTVLFNDGVLTIGDKGIISANAVGVTEIDQQIPNFVFDIRNAQGGIDRVVGIREYQRELVYWTCTNSNTVSKFPNQVLVYNYANNTWAIFRDNVTFFGIYQPPLGVTWGRFDIFWGDYEVFWSDPDTQSEYPWIVAGNQQGFVHYYAANTMDDPSLSITAINSATTPARITVPNHNLESDEVIYITDVTYTTSTNINNQIYSVQLVDANNLDLYVWNFTTEQYEEATITSVGTYIGNGKVTLLGNLDLRTKDFNPYSHVGKQMRLSYIDFLMDVTNSASMTVNMWLNSSPSTVKGNVIVGQKNTPTSTASPFYTQTSQYAWQRFYALCVGQFISLQITYDDNLRNTLTTYQQDWQLNAFTLWAQPAGRITF